MDLISFRSVSEWYGVYGDGSFSTETAFLYVVVINNISQFTAMYCLVLFYQANKVCFSSCHTQLDYT